VNGKQIKRCRSLANSVAVKQEVWKQGEASVYAKWWRKILARIFPRLRKRYADWVGRWYKRVKKDFTRQAKAYMHDREAQKEARQEARAFRVARAKVNRAYAMKRNAERVTGGT